MLSSHSTPYVHLFRRECGGGGGPTRRLAAMGGGAAAVQVQNETPFFLIFFSDPSSPTLSTRIRNQNPQTSNQNP
jgi:hypothetical protein